jgi:hypothetical protein
MAQSIIEFTYTSSGNLLSRITNGNKIYKGQAAAVEYRIKRPTDWLSSDAVFIAFERPDAETANVAMSYDADGDYWVCVSNGWETVAEGALLINAIMRRYSILDPTALAMSVTTEQVSETIYPSNEYSPLDPEDPAVAGINTRLTTLEGEMDAVQVGITVGQNEVPIRTGIGAGYTDDGIVATSEATPETLAKRDANGATKVGPASHIDHAIPKGQADAALADLAEAITVNQNEVPIRAGIGSGRTDAGIATTSEKTGNTLVKRDENGAIKVASSLSLDHATPRIEVDGLISGHNSAADAHTGLFSGKADLVAGKVPAAQLPAYVDDALEYENLAAFPAGGTAGIIYIAKDTNFSYRWTGSAYVKISNPIDFATQSEAEAGTENTKAMTALRTKQTIDYVGQFIPMYSLTMPVFLDGDTPASDYSLTAGGVAIGANGINNKIYVVVGGAIAWETGKIYRYSSDGGGAFKILSKPRMPSGTFTLSAASWVDNVQTKAGSSLILETADTIELWPDNSDGMDANEDMWISSNIKGVHNTTTNIIIFTARNGAPTADLVVRYVILRGA